MDYFMKNIGFYLCLLSSVFSITYGLQCYACSFGEQDPMNRGCADDLGFVNKSTVVPCKEEYICKISVQLNIKTSEVHSIQRTCAPKGRDKCTKDYSYRYCDNFCKTELCNTKLESDYKREFPSDTNMASKTCTSSVILFTYTVILSTIITGIH